MTTSVAGLRRYPGVLRLDAAATKERSIRRRVKTAWGLLYFNTITYAPGIIELPSKVGKASKCRPATGTDTALTINPKIKLRPNVFLCLVGLLVVDGILTASQQSTWGPNSGHSGSSSISSDSGS